MVQTERKFAFQTETQKQEDNLWAALASLRLLRDELAVVDSRWSLSSMEKLPSSPSFPGCGEGWCARTRVAQEDARDYCYGWLENVLKDLGFLDEPELDITLSVYEARESKKGGFILEISRTENEPRSVTLQGICGVGEPKVVIRTGLVGFHDPKSQAADYYQRLSYDNAPIVAGDIVSSGVRWICRILDQRING